MPLYEYRCLECEVRFERLQRVDDAPVATCPQCGGRVERLLGVPALQFKGSGWYVTDYGRSSGGKAGEESRTTGGGDSGDGGGSSTEGSSSSGSGSGNG